MAEISTNEKLGIVSHVPVAAATTIWAGTLVALNANGYAVPASATPGLLVLGRAEGTADNSDGLAGDVGIDVKRGVFAYTNSALNPVTITDIGKPCFVESASIVAISGTVPAGRVYEVDAQGVWVETIPTAVSADTLSALTFTSGGVTGAEADALRDAIVNILTAAGLIR